MMIMTIQMIIIMMLATVIVVMVTPIQPEHEDRAAPAPRCYIISYVTGSTCAASELLGIIVSGHFVYAAMVHTEWSDEPSLG